eukprot:350331-Chlamydomonas_euryale.AAC.4
MDRILHRPASWLSAAEARAERFSKGARHTWSWKGRYKHGAMRCMCPLAPPPPQQWTLCIDNIIMRTLLCVLVAGSTGRLGSRCVRSGVDCGLELLVAGKNVRAGARDPAAAKAELEKAVEAGYVTVAQARRVEIVPFDLEKLGTLEAALQGVSKVICGDASNTMRSCRAYSLLMAEHHACCFVRTCAQVVCAVGAPESDVLNTTAPRRIDGEGTISLIRAAANAGVSHFVLVTSLGTGKLGFPAGVLNLFWGVLTWKRKAEVALEESGMPYTIIRPDNNTTTRCAVAKESHGDGHQCAARLVGGMERPTDEYKATHNLRLLPRDTTFGGQVSRLQVAELVAAAISSPAVAQNKVIARCSLDARARESALEPVFLVLYICQPPYCQHARESALQMMLPLP